MIRIRARAALVLAVVSGLARSVAAAPSADEAAAEALFDEAKKLMKEGRVAEACPKLEESQRLDPAVGTLLHLGDCYEKAGKLASAWAKYREAAASARASGRADREKTATARADGIAKRLSKLVVSVAPQSDRADLEVRRDGTVVGRAQWGDAVPVDGGDHVISASAPGAVPWSVHVDVPVEGKVVSVSVPPLAVAPAPATSAPPPAASPPAASPSSSPAAPARADSSLGTQRTLAIAAGALGLVAVGAGTYFGLTTRSKWRDARDNHCQGTTCDPTGVALVDDAKSAGRWANVSFVVGAAALGGAAALWLTASPRSPEVGAAVGPRSFAVSATARW